MITLLVNDQKKEVPEPITIKEYLIFADIHHKRGVAIAINDEVVPKSKWNDHLLKAFDRMTIITATAGG